MKIVVALTARPSYAKIRPVLTALMARSADVTLLACASALLERYGRVVDVARRDFPTMPIVECWSTYEGANLLTSAKETGALLSEAATALERIQADRVLVVADRHEVLAVAQATHYLHRELFHMQGGERSGSVDNRVRDSITALADYHFPCTKRAALRVYSLTGAHDRVWNFGCPSIDIAKQAMNEPPVTVDELGGAGAPIDLGKPFLTVLFHPVTNEAHDAANQMHEVLSGAGLAWQDRIQVLVMWPGEDAGAEAISKVIRERNIATGSPWFHTLRNLPPNRFLRLMAQCAVIVGNSSASIRECAYIGTPAVVVGTRQRGRERGPNVIDVAPDQNAIYAAITRQIAHGPYPSSPLYGDGTAVDRIAEVLACL